MNQTDPVKMTIAASYTLYNTINQILYEDDKKTERNINFGIKYKLLRSKDLLEKDVLFFENERNQLIRELGASDESSGTIKVTDENMPKFQESLQKLLKIEVEHTLFKLKPEDMENIVGVNLDAQSMGLFMAAMIDDPLLEEDIKKPINRENFEDSESNN